jgi:hypothetical protein
MKDHYCKFENDWNGYLVVKLERQQSCFYVVPRDGFGAMSRGYDELGA